LPASADLPGIAESSSYPPMGTDGWYKLPQCELVPEITEGDKLFFPLLSAFAVLAPARNNQSRGRQGAGGISRLGQFRSTILTRGRCTSSPRNRQDLFA
jgi:hypothetical protein